MKLFILALFAASLASAATTNRLFLAWDSYPLTDTNLVTFHIYSTTNIALPVSQWPHLTNVDYSTATNAAKPGEGGRVEVLAAENMFRFYSMTASNFIGESDFSDVVSVRRVAPPSAVRLGVLSP